MEQRTNKPTQNKKNIWAIIVPIIATTLIVGGLIYWWQNQQFQKYETKIESIKTELQSKETNELSLLKEIEQLKKQAQDSETGETENIAQTTGDVFGDKYANNTYNFSFTIPSSWVFQKEEQNIGGDPIRLYLTVPGFKEKTLPGADYILSISVTERIFEEEYQYVGRNVSKESEEKITVAGREAVKRIGRHEFGGYLTVVILPNENNTIGLVLRTNEEPYASQFKTLLDSFEFAE